MARRTSSKDDIFLSSMDLWSILLFSFAGLAFLTNNTHPPVSELDLPVIPTPSKNANASNSRTVRIIWTNSSPRGSDGLCEISAWIGDNSEETMAVPCWPAAFGGRTLPAPPQLEASAHSGYRAIILCSQGKEIAASVPEERKLETCARLHWIVAEMGFETAIAVQDG